MENHIEFGKNYALSGEKTFADVLKKLREDRDLAKTLGINDKLDQAIAVVTAEIGRAHV